MKTIAILFLFVTNISIGYCQSIDETIKKVSDDLAEKISRKHITRLGLLDFTNEENKQDPAVAYIQEQVETNLINAPDLTVIDRKHIKDILSENHLVSEGLIDESTIKKAVSFFKVDGWVIGEITNIGNKFRLKLKVIDLNTSQIFAVSESDFIDATQVNELLGPKQCPYCKGTGRIMVYKTCTVCNGTGGPKCSSCGGSGIGIGWGNPRCPICNGKGKIECKVCGGTGHIVAYETCEKCNGTGKEL